MPRARELGALLAQGPPLVYAAIKEVLRETETEWEHTPEVSGLRAAKMGA